MLKSNILASNLIYFSTEHKIKNINYYFKTLEPIFEKIADCEDGYDIKIIRWSCLSLYVSKIELIKKLKMLRFLKGIKF